jgi:hypothetical protein
MGFLKHLGRRAAAAPYGYMPREPQGYRYRVEKRDILLARHDLSSGVGDGPADDERQRLARVLESLSIDGWKLIGVSDGDFIFRRRS